MTPMPLVLYYKCHFSCLAGHTACKPFLIDGFQVGLLQANVLEQLAKYPDVFHIYKESVELNPALRDYNERSKVLDSILRDWRENQTFVTLKGWREEVRLFHYITSRMITIKLNSVCFFSSVSK